MLHARHMLQAILVNSGDTGPSLSVQIVCWWEVTLGACLDAACRVDRKEQILHKSPGHLGKCKSALPVKNRVRKYQPVSSHGVCMDPDTTIYTDRTATSLGPPQTVVLSFETCCLSGGLFYHDFLCPCSSMEPGSLSGREALIAQAGTRATPGPLGLQFPQYVLISAGH